MFLSILKQKIPEEMSSSVDEASDTVAAFSISSSDSLSSSASSSVGFKTRQLLK